MNDYTNVTCEEVAGWFSIGVEQLKGAKIVFGFYDNEDYSGSAFVLYKKARKLYEVNGSHCSCYGLEDQWSPEETTKEALLHRLDNGYFYGKTDELREVLNKKKTRKVRG